jgi:hypothetical protein
MIQFGEWLPDQPDFQNGGVTEAQNVLPAFSGYRSMPSFVPYSGEAVANINGVFAAKENDGSVKLFAGDTGNLYEFNAGDSSLDGIGKIGGYTLTAPEESWDFVQFGKDVLASGGIGVPIQRYTLGTSSVFADLAGSPPDADFMTVVRDFVWLGNVEDGSGNRLPYRVQWSGFNDITSWTPGTDQSDFQEIPDAGNITGMVGGEYCTILMERAIVRATYTGPPLIWQFDKVETARGCQIPGSVCNIGHTVFYYSDDGFYSFDGQSSKNIGAEKVDRFFSADHNISFKNKMTSSVDPQNQIAVWSYVSNNSVDGEPDKMLVYNYAIGRWSLLNVSAGLIAPFFSPAYTLENLDNISTSLDALPASLDSALYKGGQFLFGGALGKRLYAFTGDPLAGLIETSEAGLSSGKFNIVTRVYPYHRGGSVTIQIGTRGLHSESTAFGETPVAPNDDGFAPFRSQGRYHRARMNISGNWEFAQGMDIEARSVGRR